VTHCPERDSPQQTAALMMLWAIEIACLPLIDQLTHEQLERIDRSQYAAHFTRLEAVPPEQREFIAQAVAQALNELEPRLTDVLERVSDTFKGWDGSTPSPRGLTQ